MALSVVSIQDREEVFSAPSLQDICIRFCLDNTKTLLLSSSSPPQDKKPAKLRKSVQLPNDVWEKLLESFDVHSEHHLPLVHAVHHKFPSLRKIHVRNSIHLKDEELSVILQSFPVSLDIHNCPTLTKKAIDSINKFGKNLECLFIGTTTQIIPTNIDNWLGHKKEEDEQGFRKITKSIARLFARKFSGDDDDQPHGLLTTPKLRKLIIWGHHITQMQPVRRKILSDRQNTPEELPTNEETGGNVNSGSAAVAGGGDSSSSAKVTVDYWEYMTREFIQVLEYLDLSSCQEILDLNFLQKAKASLTSLHLHDVLLDYDQNTWGVLRQLSKLKYLDVSQYNELASMFANPDQILHQLVSSLPELVGLDISGTNLAGFDPGSTSLTNHSIGGLASRNEKPLALLGLLTTHYNASSRTNIPALQIAGGESIDQLILALKLYLHRDNILRKAVRILHEHLLRTNQSTDFIPCYTILDLLLQVISLHIEDKHTAIVSLAAMFHVLKRIFCGTVRHTIGKCHFRLDRVFHAIVRAMDIHPHDLSLMRNGVLNMLLLASHLNIDANRAEKLVPVLLEAGICATSTEAARGDMFLIKAVAHLLYSVTHFEDPKLMERLMDSDAPEQLCLFMSALLDKRILDQMATFWIILLKFIGGKRGKCGGGDGGGEKDDAKIYERFAGTRMVDLCFKLIKLCNDERFDYDGESSREIQPLRQIQKPVLAFLTNMLYNGGSAASTSVIRSEHVLQAFMIPDGSGETDHELMHVCCGFLAHVASKAESHRLVHPPRLEILCRIFRIMKGMSRNSKFTFTFRNLSLLYELLKVQNAPEIHYWALWTLVKLAEDDDKFIDMIIQDGKLNLGSLHRQYSSEQEGGGDFQRYRELETLRDHLSHIVDKHYAKTYSNND